MTSYHTYIKNLKYLNMHATVSSLNVENFKNSNVKTDFQEYIGWEGAVYERLKA